jgi:lysozyme
MNIGKEGIALIKEFEGCKLQAYKCPAGVWTIGVGSTRYANGSKVKEGDKLRDEAEADELLKATLATFTHAVNTAIHPPMAQNEFDALVCLCYNIGTTGFATSTLVKLFNAGVTKDEISHQFLRWDKAGGKPLAGLTRRRAAEAKLFLKAG